MFLVVDVDKMNEPDIRIEELDFEYALPRWAWTNSEWYIYHMKRKALLNELKENLRLDDVYLQSLEFNEGI